jgi:opacity protein-like surface antigen
MKQRGRFLWICLFLLTVCTPAQSSEGEYSKFILGIKLGLGKWTSQINREVLLYPLPSFPSDYTAGIMDTETDINFHLGFNFLYNFTPKFGLQMEFSRINAEYLILLWLRPRWGGDSTQYDPVSLPWTLTTVYLNGVFSFHKTPGKVVPFAFAGVGFNVLHKKSALGKYFEVASKSTMDFGLKGGGGISYDLPGAPLGFELRAFILYLTTAGVESYSYFSHTTPSPEFSSQNLVWGVDFGLRYRF